MPVSTDNIRRWIEKSEIDYFTQFIKAWIPFNAWYKNSYATLGSDRAIINEIKRSSNNIRNAINNYFERTDAESNEFKNNVTNLHHSLQNITLEIENRRICFNEIVLESNQNRIVNQNRNRTRYFIERTDDANGRLTNIRIIVKNQNNSVIFNLPNQTNYDFNEIISHSDYNNLSQDRKNNLRQYYSEINPLKATSLIRNTTEKTTQNCYECDGVLFVREDAQTIYKADLLSKGIIEIMYCLRNILFHGELNPTEEANNVYKYAFSILEMLLKKIR